ncbi:hypothetical protein, partial [Chloroflexus sp.]|uniref:hypothetical protein n=1 Tax=Chloroflexus sp. TaxID=1904827 RepID=UPI002ADE8C27
AHVGLAVSISRSEVERQCQGQGTVQTQKFPKKTAQLLSPACPISASTLAQTINRSMIMWQIA